MFSGFLTAGAGIRQSEQAKLNSVFVSFSGAGRPVLPAVSTWMLQPYEIPILQGYKCKS
jgi:hypothetical protein